MHWRDYRYSLESHETIRSFRSLSTFLPSGENDGKRERKGKRWQRKENHGTCRWSHAACSILSWNIKIKEWMRKNIGTWEISCRERASSPAARLKTNWKERRRSIRVWWMKKGRKRRKAALGLFFFSTPLHFSFLLLLAGLAAAAARRSGASFFSFSSSCPRAKSDLLLPENQKKLLLRRWKRGERQKEEKRKVAKRAKWDGEKRILGCFSNFYSLLKSPFH